MRYTDVEYVTCPECGGTCEKGTCLEDVAMYTGEYIDEGEPEIETVTLTGWYVRCQSCEFCDGEPPSY